MVGTVTPLNYPKCGLKADEIWLVYNLMRGGIEAPLELEKYTTIDVERLRAVDLQEIFLWADNHWQKRKRYWSARIGLPAGVTITCRRCWAAMREIPCGYCECMSYGPDWVTKFKDADKKYRRGVWLRTGSETSARIARSEQQYHGDNWES